MNVLVLNCGSSSVKFQLIETSLEQMSARSDRVLARGEVERIGEPEPVLRVSAGSNGSERKKVRGQGYGAALDSAFEWMTTSGVLNRPDEVEAVGHRVVHGGPFFHDAVKIDEETLSRIRACSDLAPLHNPHNIEGYLASRARLPAAIHVAVFDTAFHYTMPPRAHLYGLPWDWYERAHIRRYGFHGISHRYVMGRFAEIRHTKPEVLKLITCHLGNGCSVCAIDHGKSIDTSMGFTPLEGLLMSSRVGDLDPGALLYARELFKLSAKEMETILNEQSGMLALSGVSPDMREVLQAKHDGAERARIAVDAFCYRVAKYIGCYFVALGGADGVVFTGGIGENSAEIRRIVCGFLSPLSLKLNDKANSDSRGVEKAITHPDSKLAAWVIPTDEELLIARDTVRCVLGNSKAPDLPASAKS